MWFPTLVHLKSIRRNLSSSVRAKNTQGDEGVGGVPSGWRANAFDVYRKLDTSEHGDATIQKH